MVSIKFNKDKNQIVMEGPGMVATIDDAIMKCGVCSAKGKDPFKLIDTKGIEILMFASRELDEDGWPKSYLNLCESCYRDMLSKDQMKQWNSL